MACQYNPENWAIRPNPEDSEEDDIENTFDLFSDRED